MKMRSRNQQVVTFLKVESWPRDGDKRCCTRSLSKLSWKWGCRSAQNSFSFSTLSKLSRCASGTATGVTVVHGRNIHIGDDPWMLSSEKCFDAVVTKSYSVRTELLEYDQTFSGHSTKTQIEQRPTRKIVCILIAPPHHCSNSITGL